MTERKGRYAIREQIYKDIRYVLGQDIYDHYLVKGHEPTINRIKGSYSIFSIVNILNGRHKAVHGTDKIFGSRKLHFKYKGENSPSLENPRASKQRGYYKKKKKPSLVGDYLKRHANSTIPKQSEEKRQQLSIQTFDEFIEKRKRDEVVKKLLSDPEPNFHYE